jgi:hypothetical protein
MFPVIFEAEMRDDVFVRVCVVTRFNAPIWEYDTAQKLAHATILSFVVLRFRHDFRDILTIEPRRFAIGELKEYCPAHCVWVCSKSTRDKWTLVRKLRVQDTVMQPYAPIEKIDPGKMVHDRPLFCYSSVGKALDKDIPVVIVLGIVPPRPERVKHLFVVALTIVFHEPRFCFDREKSRVVIGR